MTVTIIVEGRIWFQSDSVEDLEISEGLLSVCKGEDGWVHIEMERVDQVLATDY